MQSESDDEDKSVEQTHVRDMTLASMVGLSPSEHHKITRTSMDFKDMTLASMVDRNTVSLQSLVPNTQRFQNEENMNTVINENNIKECQKSETIDLESEEIKFMRALIEEQNQQIELYEAEFESINKEMQSLREKRDYLIKEKTEIEQVFVILIKYSLSWLRLLIIFFFNL